MTELDLIADRLGVSGRTLRRAVARGLLRAGSERGDRLLPASERRYVQQHWGLLHVLVGALRTEPNVRLAVLFGSAARGDFHPGSDLDVAVRFAGRRAPLAPAGLGLRLSERLGRPVQVLDLDEACSNELLLTDIVRDGRVLVDRDGDWQPLIHRAQAAARSAHRAEDELERAAWQVLESLGR